MQLQVKSFDIIPENIYPATLQAIEPKDNDTGSFLLWTFEIAGRTKTVEITATSSTSFGTKSKAYAWACTLLGRKLAPKEVIDTDDLCGQQARLVVKVETRDDGSERNKVTELLPLHPPANETEPF